MKPETTEEMIQVLAPALSKAFAMPIYERAQHEVCLLCFGLFRKGSHICKVAESLADKKLCGEKATITKLCHLPKGHPGAHDEDP